MKQVLQDLKTGKIEVAEVPCPNVGQGMVLIQSSHSLISAGTERMMVEFSKASLISKARSHPEKVRQVLDKMRTDGILPTLETIFHRLDEPMPLGYCNAGRVLAVGPGVYDLQIGDRVISNGAHAEIVCVPRNLVAKIPSEVDGEEASFTVLASVGLQGIRLAQPTLGERFIVFGTGLLGLMTVQILKANSCSVMAVDINLERLKIAESFGAETVNTSGGGDPVTAAQVFSKGRGVDGVIICASASSNEIIHQAALACRKRGRIILVGVVGLNLKRDDFYKKELTFQVACSYGPGRYDENYEQKGQDYPYGYVRWTEGRNFEAVLEMLSQKKLDVKPLVTHRFPLEKAPEAYEKIRNRESLGVILEYPENVNLDRQIVINPHPKGKLGAIKGCQKAVIGVIGAGHFATGTILPALRKTGARIKYIAGNTNTVGLTHIARKFNVEQAITDCRVIFEDAEVNTIFILTRHNTHSCFVIESLKAGKNVFVEKPLCINKNELDAIRENYVKMSLPKPLLMVGFNRRFSPHTLKIKELIAERKEPLCMNITVNAGSIPPEHWIQNPEIGGGRIIGEGCHFIDLLSFIADSPVVYVSAVMSGEGPSIREDRMSIQMRFADGSIGNVNYFANGSKSYSKEVLEVFSEGRILSLENFRQVRGFNFRGFKIFRTRRQDKGHNREVAEFIRCVENGGNALIPFNELVNITMASFAAVESAKTNKVVTFSL